MYSNSYIFRYAAILVILVAAVLSTATLLLKPAQDRNIAVAKMEGILAAAQVQATAADAIKLYDKYIIEEELISPDGEVKSIYKDGKFEKGKERAFELDMKKQLYNKVMGKDYVVPLYIAEKDGDTLYIVPMVGKGLWGPLTGNIALKSDFNTIAGATFTADKETPGLGAEIVMPFFEDQFIGKKIFDASGNFVSINVVKGGIKQLSEKQQIHAVDAVSGGTITSNGVKDMLRNNLDSYVAYIKKNIKQ